MNKKIFIHITLFIIVQMLINMLMFIAFIPFVKADGWVSPTGYVDIDGRWYDETKIYDSNTATFGYNYYASGADFWGGFVELTLGSSISSSKIRYYMSLYSQGEPIDQIDIDVYDTTSGWINVYQGSYSASQWVEKSFTEKTISKARWRFHFQTYYMNYGYFHEFEFWEITAPPDNPPKYSNVSDNGVTQVGEDVTVNCFWEDDFELDTCYVEHNSTGAFANYSISVSGSSSWANKTFQLNFTANIKVGYKWYCSDNATQWNSTNYYYITTTQLYITFNLNNSTYGRFYVDLVDTANNTQNGYDYNETIFLLGATYNASYVWCNFTYSETVITENFYNYQTDGNKTLWSYFNVCNTTGNGNGNGNYTENDLHEYFVLGAVISGAYCIIFTIIIINRKDLIRGK